MIFAWDDKFKINSLPENFILFLSKFMMQFDAETKNLIESDEKNLFNEIGENSIKYVKRIILMLSKLPNFHVC